MSQAIRILNIKNAMKWFPMKGTRQYHADYLRDQSKQCLLAAKGVEDGDDY